MTRAWGSGGRVDLGVGVWMEMWRCVEERDGRVGGIVIYFLKEVRAGELWLALIA